ncbi:MAG: hypothetical protein H6849_04650 [Alphaproteobacteria bacterium]|nr:MAG: hypothetical protein H6849_04650 [Alphaproteobacteria bacterium]
MRFSFCHAIIVTVTSALLVVGGCTTFPSSSFSPQTLKPRDVIRIPVATIQIVNDYLPYGEDPYVDHTLSPSPSVYMEDWLAQKFIATGHEGSVIIRIQEASLRWRKRPGNLRTMKYWPYRAIVRLHLERINRQGVRISEEKIQTTRVREIHEGYFRRPRHKDWWEMFADVRKDLAFELKRRLSQKNKEHLPLITQKATSLIKKNPVRRSQDTATPFPLKKPLHVKYFGSP